MDLFCCLFETFAIGLFFWASFSRSDIRASCPLCLSPLQGCAHNNQVRSRFTNTMHAQSNYLLECDVSPVTGYKCYYIAHPYYVIISCTPKTIKASLHDGGIQYKPTSIVSQERTINRTKLHNATSPTNRMASKKMEWQLWLIIVRLIINLIRPSANDS